MKYCRWKLYGNLSNMTHHFKCVKCCHCCKKLCGLKCRSSHSCNLGVTALEYLMIKLTSQPIEKLEEEGLVRA